MAGLKKKGLKDNLISAISVLVIKCVSKKKENKKHKKKKNSNDKNC